MRALLDIWPSPTCRILGKASCTADRKGEGTLSPACATTIDALGLDAGLALAKGRLTRRPGTQDAGCGRPAWQSQLRDKSPTSKTKPATLSPDGCNPDGPGALSIAGPILARIATHRASVSRRQTTAAKMSGLHTGSHSQRTQGRKDDGHVASSPFRRQSPLQSLRFLPVFPGRRKLGDWTSIVRRRR